MFQFDIPVLSPQKAFEILVNRIDVLNWYVANGRSYQLDFYKNFDSPLVQEMLQNKETIQCKQDWALYYERFTKELYDDVLYKAPIKEIQKSLPLVQRCFKPIEALNQSWGFEILPRYSIDLNVFGLGGQYWRAQDNTGHIFIGVGNAICSQEKLASLITHELLHLGIGQKVINPKNLQKPPVQQEEKERIVDNLCLYVMKGVIPYEYQKIAEKCSYMDTVVGIQPQDNLVNNVNLFLKNKAMHLRQMRDVNADRN